MRIGWADTFKPVNPSLWLSRSYRPLLARGRKLVKLAGVVVAAIALQAVTGCTNIDFAARTVAQGTYTLPVTATDSNGNRDTANLTIVVAPVP
jgi:hypothetical protein